MTRFVNVFHNFQVLKCDSHCWVIALFVVFYFYISNGFYLLCWHNFSSYWALLHCTWGNYTDDAHTMKGIVSTNRPKIMIDIASNILNKTNFGSSHLEYLSPEKWWIFTQISVPQKKKSKIQDCSRNIQKSGSNALLELHSKSYLQGWYKSPWSYKLYNCVTYGRHFKIVVFFSTQISQKQF